MKRRNGTVAAAVVSCVLSFLSANTAGGADQDGQIIAITTYDKSGAPQSSLLRNAEGREIAGLKYNIDGRTITLSDASGRTLHIMRFNQKGEVGDPRWLCLNSKGDIVVGKNGRPVLIKPFDIRQHGRVETEWGDWVKSKETTRFKSCQNCEEQGGTNCKYVWPEP